tara:strand:+ start:320 stop:727 length:408 start_codon:yes stop_codon:yes gene_type:complete
MPLKPGTQNTVEKHTGVGGVVSITKDPFAPVVVGRTHLDYKTMTIDQDGITQASPGVFTSVGHNLTTNDILIYNTEGGTALVSSAKTYADGDVLYVVRVNDDTFNIASERNGSALQITNDGNDNQTFSRLIGKVT